jgi:hypothetical protein
MAKLPETPPNQESHQIACPYGCGTFLPGGQAGKEQFLKHTQACPKGPKNGETFTPDLPKPPPESLSH